MLSRLAGRLLVSPLAFLLAGAVDVAGMLVIYARWRLREERGRRAAGGAGATGS